MFTVILLTDAARALFEPARIYFAPFEEAGHIAFCEWNQSATARGLREAVPQLPEVIRGRAAWRAVVVDHPRGSVGEDRHPENPFDFADNDDTTLNLEDSKHAVIRLSHVLLGYPHLTAKHFQPYLQYEDAETGATVEGEPRQLLADHVRRARLAPGFALDEPHTEDEWFALATMVLGQTHNNVRRLFREVEYSSAERAAHTALVERYQMKEVRPSEVIFVATRADVEENEEDALRRAWRSGDDQGPSRFVERNDYPPMSRFSVYELHEEEHSGYDQDLLRFWLSVLTIATNQLPPGSFQAERLYELGVSFQNAGLSDMLNSHLSTLAMVRDHLDRLISTPRRAPELTVEALLAPVETAVPFDDLGGHELSADPAGYGLVSDRPRHEVSRWRDDVGQVSRGARSFLRKPRRGVSRAVLSTRELALVEEDAITLDEIDREELDEELTRRLRELVVPATTDLLDEERLQRTIDEGDREVTATLVQRMSIRTASIAATVALGIWFAALVPYLIQAGRNGVEALADGAIVLILVLAAVGAAGLGMLLVSRMRLRAVIGRFNDAVQDEVAAVHSSASRFADFLSGFVTFRRGSSRLRGANRAQDERAARLRRLRRLRTFVGDKIVHEKGIVTSLGTTVSVHRTTRGLVDFDPDDEHSVRALFRFPTGENLIPFNDSGERIRAPYDFISALSLERLAVFEPQAAVVTAPVGATESDTEVAR